MKNHADKKPRKFSAYTFSGFYKEIVSFGPKNSEAMEEMRIIDLVKKIDGKTITEVNDLLNSVTAKIDGEEYVFKCEKDLLKVLEQVLIMKEQNLPLDCIWYFYDSSWRDTSSYYYFFLVNNGEIICDRIVISQDAVIKNKTIDYLRSSENWDSDPWNMAVIKWSYNKFYSETNAGQILKIKEEMARGDFADRKMAFIHSLFEPSIRRTNEFLLLISIILSVIAFRLLG